MILIYSDICKHCNILLETIDKHDKNNIVKKISLDSLRKGYNIDNIIHSVPALISKIDEKKKINKDDILFGKQVFDYLLLPNRGILFTQENNTRLNKEIKDSKENINMSDNQEDNGPSAFTLGSSLSDKFSLIDESDDNILKDKMYSWDVLRDDNDIEKIVDNSSSINPISSTNQNNELKLPSIEELLNKRNQDII